MTIRKLIILSFLIWAQVAPAQTGNFRFSRLDISQGLSNNQVNSIFKDRMGFLWIGTMSGLNRFDGYAFRIFRHSLHDSLSLSDDFVTAIYEGPGAKLWIGTRNGFNVFDPRTETFDRNAGARLQDLGIVNGTITYMERDQAGDFWFLMNQQQLYRYREGSSGATLVRQAPQGNTMVAFSTDRNGDGWMLYGDGLMEMINPGTGQVINSVTRLREATGGQPQNYSCFIDGQNDLWIYSTAGANGVFHYQPANGRFEHFTRDEGRLRLNTNLVVKVLQDNNKNIWICTDHGGVNILDKGESRIHYLLNNVDDAKSLSQNSTTTAYRDESGIIWVGTYKKGISYYHENIIKFPLFRNLPSNTNSLPYNDVNRFVEDRQGNLWIGTNGGGLIYFNRQTNHFIRYRHDAQNSNSLCNDVIVSLCLDHNNQLWIGTYFGGLDRFDGKHFIHYRHNPADSNSLADDRVWEIFEDREMNLWVGTLGSGLDRFNRSRNRFEHRRMGDAGGLHSNYISTLLEDRSGMLWIGTAFGIDVLDPKTGAITFYGGDGNSGSQLSNNNIISMLEDSHGLLIWVGTRDGLNVFNKEKKTFQVFRTEDGLPSNTILNILEDEQHHIWVSTSNGVSRIIPSVDYARGSVTINCHNYDELDGLQGTEFNENAALRTASGELVFGGANGFNMFRPETIRSNNSNPPLLMTGLQIFNKPVDVGDKLGGRVLLNQSISTTSNLTLHYSENVLSFEFAALSFANSEKIKYAYQLQGFNKEWLTTDGSMRKATYTNLDPGEYHFFVKAANEDGTWNPSHLLLTVNILPPFWKTPWAYLIYVLAAAGLLWLARQIIVQRARMRFAMDQQKQEAQRLHELDMMKIRFFTNVSHEFRTPLSLILSPLEKILTAREEPEEKKQLQLVHRNARRLLNLVNQLLDFRKMEVQELKLNARPGNIIRFVRETVQSFADMAETRGIEFSVSIPPVEKYVLFDPDKLERILFNLLSNAFKFTPEKGTVSVVVSLSGTDPELLNIAVRDTGIGIAPDKLEKIFERFFQNEIPGSIVNQGSGIGLSISREFVRLHQGSIDVTSTPGSGSCFLVKLPLVPAMGLEEPADSTEMAMEPEETTLAATGSHTKKPSLLLVEDNEDFLFYLKDNLRQHFTILEASNGREGWQKALAQHPDLVVSDISMPGMNGIELCTKIKQDKRTAHLPVILLTALTGQDQQLKGLETGANDYITKPFNFELLLSRIRNLLDEQARLKKSFQKQVDIPTANISLASPDEQFIIQAMALMDKHLSDADFSVEDLSRELHMSRVSLYKKMLVLTGKTPTEFIRSYRLRRAAQLLEKSRMTISEIAYEVGFNNPKYFARYFKAEYDMLPSAYLLQKRKAGRSSAGQ